MVVNPTRGQLNRAENEFSLFPFMPKNLISRDRLNWPLASFFPSTQVESGEQLKHTRLFLRNLLSYEKQNVVRLKICCTRLFALFPNKRYGS